MPRTVRGECRLCGNERDLQRSHIIPKFVTRWLINTAPTGGLRTARNINERIQDGEKRNLLCSECEQIFRKDESDFARYVFLPFHENQASHFDYKEWALRFAVSVAWRALVYQGEEPFTYLSQGQLETTRQAEKVWREFLLGTRPNPGQYGLHLITLGFVGRADAEALARVLNLTVSPHMNRYIARAVMNDVVRGKIASKDIVVFVKMCRLVIVGVIGTETPTQWRPTAINLKQGRIDASVGPVFPPWLLEYMNSKADQVRDSFDGMSETQRALLSERLLANADAVADSEVFRAVQMDVAIHGMDALVGDTATENDI